MAVNVKSVFIYGRPGPHPFNRAMIEAISPDLIPIDFLLRWYDIPSSHVRRYLSWLLCALFFSARQKYHVFITDGIQFFPLIMRRLGLLKPWQKVVALVGDETLFCLRAGRYQKLSARALTWAINEYDALFCLGQMETKLAEPFVKRDGPLLLTTQGCISRHRISTLLQNQATLDANTMLFIGNGPSEWRGWYKGLDLLLPATELAASDLAGLRLSVVGQWDQNYIQTLMARFPGSSRITEFVELNVYLTDVLSHHLSNSAFYVHLGRGEAWGLSVLEAMCAGVPTLVSEWTGAREAVAQVDSNLIVPLDAELASERIRWYFGLSLRERRLLSTRSREIASQYTEEKAQSIFISEFRRMLRHFNLPDLNPTLSAIYE